MSSSVIPSSMTRRIRWAVVVPLAALTLLGASACGSGGAHPRSEQMQAYRQCLSEHGVTLASHPRDAGAAPGATPGATDGSTDGSAPAGAGAGRHRDMSTPPPGVTQQAWDSARAACASVAPSPAAAAPSTAGS